MSDEELLEPIDKISMVDWIRGKQMETYNHTYVIKYGGHDFTTVYFHLGTFSKPGTIEIKGDTISKHAKVLDLYRICEPVSEQYFIDNTQACIHKFHIDDDDVNVFIEYKYGVFTYSQRCNQQKLFNGYPEMVAIIKLAYCEYLYHFKYSPLTPGDDGI